MNQFQVGDRVRCVDIPNTYRAEFEAHPVLTVSHVDDDDCIGFLEHNDIQGEWDVSRFKLVHRTMLNEAKNPNAGMIEADEDEEKAKQYEAMLERKWQLLRSSIRKPAKGWPTSGEQLTTAIEKTLNRAEHPHAMWPL